MLISGELLNKNSKLPLRTFQTNPDLSGKETTRNFFLPILSFPPSFLHSFIPQIPGQFLGHWVLFSQLLSVPSRFESVFSFFALLTGGVISLSAFP
jgi:hypothetical protein